MKTVFKGFAGCVSLLASIFVCIGVGTASLVEGFFIFAPYIDTEMAPDFSPRKGSKVTIGMTAEEVRSIIGEPLFIKYDRWLFTNDSYWETRRKNSTGWFRPNGSDFAWYRFRLTMDDEGRVMHIDKGWSFD